MRKIISILLSAVILISLTACGGNSDDNTGVTSGSSLSNITDRQGNNIKVPDKTEKIISTSPSNTEILTGLGLGDKIIATDTFSNGIEGLNENAIAFDMQNLNMEKLIELKPDAIFVNEISLAGEEDRFAAVRKAGIDVLYIPAADSLQDIMDDITFISAYTKTDDKGKAFVKEIEDTINTIKDKTKDSESTTKVYFEISAAPYLYTFGTGTYLNEIIELCGGVNIYNSQKGWLTNTDESVISSNPSVIISNVSYDGYSYKEILDRKGWNVIDAVKNKKVFYVDANSTARASQNVVRGMKEIANAINPDIFG